MRWLTSPLVCALATGLANRSEFSGEAGARNQAETSGVDQRAAPSIRVCIRVHYVGGFGVGDAHVRVADSCNGGKEGGADFAHHVGDDSCGGAGASSPECDTSATSRLLLLVVDVGVSLTGISRSAPQFGKEGAKLLMVKSFVNWFSDKLERIFASENKRNAWYDTHFMRAVAARHRLENPDDVEDDVDLGEEDFGDADGLTAGIDM